MAIKKTEKHVSKKGGKGGYTYSVNLNSPSKIPADRLTTKQKARREAKNVLFSQLPFTECDRAEIPKILDIAKEIIHGDREQAYGDPRFNLDTIAMFWTLYLHRLFHSWGIEGAKLKAEDVAQMMILLKTARLIHNPTHKDSLVDQAGYAALQGRINGL